MKTRRPNLLFRNIQRYEEVFVQVNAVEPLQFVRHPTNATVRVMLTLRVNASLSAQNRGPNTRALCERSYRY